MRKETIVYGCDACGEDFKDGYAVYGGICNVNKDVFTKIIDLGQGDEEHYCKPCFKAKLGMRERVSKIKEDLVDESVG